MHNEKKYDELSLEWQPYYNPEHVNIEKYETLKLAPAQHAVLMIRPDTGYCAILCTYRLKSMAVKYAEYSNKKITLKQNGEVS